MVVEALLSSCIQVLFERLASQEVVDFILGKKSIDGLIKKLKITLLSVNSVLNDAEERQLSDNAVKEWLDELKEAIYDAEDLMIEINSEASQRKSEVESENTNANKVKKFVLTYLFDKAMESKVEGVVERLEFVVKQKDVLGLRVGLDRPFWRSRFIPLVNESSVYGRRVDKDFLVDLLLCDDGDSDAISVIPIVGMGGIGKTTLAQLVYNDERVWRNFGPKVWVTVSDGDEFDAFQISKKIFEALTCESCGIKDLRQLQVQMKALLRKRKFLFVLDDVWTENYVDWDVLKSPFEFCARGSKIVVTTRSEKVASIVGNVSAFRVQMMSEEDSWLLFAKHAFDGGDWCSYPSLESIGRKIVQKCEGLPSAVKSLGGLLRSKLNVEEWEEMLKRNTWELLRQENRVLPSLWLSYHHLPSHLKRCFAYCSIFPKGYELGKQQLILLWMAEGLLQERRGKTIEDVGEEYFQELVSRSLFRQSTRESKLVITLHDLVHDLAMFISGEFCTSLKDWDLDNLVSKTRHLSFMNENIYAYEGIMMFEQLVASKESCLRTFLSLRKAKVSHLLSPNKWILPTIPTTRCLRVLSLIGYHIEELPHSISNLKHLRYLDLTQAKIKELPKTIYSLQNLQILLLNSCLSLKQLPSLIGNLKQLRYIDLSFSVVKGLPETISALSNLQSLLLSNCEYLTQLPTTLERLTNLRHLDISGTRLAEIPQNIGSLKALQTLSDFSLSGNNRPIIRELKELTNLRGGLRISGLDEHANVEDVVEANLRDKKYLTELKLMWKGHTNNAQREREILDSLQPQENLKELLIQCYSGPNFSDWIGLNSFSNMVKVSLIDCTNCNLLPSLGELPSLQELQISGLDNIVSISVEFYSIEDSTICPFKSLKVLHFEHMLRWQEWSFIHRNEDCPRIFPRLEELRLINCPALDLFSPNDLNLSFQSLQRVRLEKCPKLELFPGGRFPKNVMKLEVSGCNRFLERRLKWDLNRFGSLKSLRIEDSGDLELGSFPDEGLLPQSLISLALADLPKLKLLNNNAIQQLGFLRKLKIYDCPLLESLPIEELPSSLSKLRITNCGNLGAAM